MVETRSSTSIEDPISYSLGEGIALDQEVFAAFADEYGLVESDRVGGGTSWLTVTFEQLKEFHAFHAAFRYGKEVQDLEDQLASEMDPKKRMRLRRQIESRKNTDEYRKYIELLLRKYLERDHERDKDDR